MMEGLGEALGGFFSFVAWVLVPLSLLGLWKLVEIIIWLFQHVRVMP